MYLVINLGLKSIRGIVFDLEGEQIFSTSYPIHTALSENRVEQDANEWLSCLQKIMTDISNESNFSSQITHITCTASSSCFLGLDSKFQPITKVIMVSDKRAAIEVSEINEAIEINNIDRERITNSTSCAIPKILWFKKNDATTFRKVKYWLGACEFIGQYFMGEVVTDTVNATKSLYNGNNYETQLIERLDLDPKTLPKVVEIGTVLRVKNAIAKMFKLNASCQYIVTTYDAICAVIGSSISSDSNACDVSGTVTSVRILSDFSVQQSSESLLVQPLTSLQKFSVGSSNNLGGGIIEWLKQSFFESEGNDVYFEMENKAQQSPIGSRGIVFLPYLLGERSPFIANNASGSFFGISRRSNLKDFTRAVFEAAAYITRDLLDLIERAGIQVNSISVSGGLSRFDTINQIKADVCNKPVHVISNFESTSTGAFVLMALATRKFNSLEEAISKVVKIRKTIYPSKRNNQIYDQCFGLYKQLNQQLLPMYDLHKIMTDNHISLRNEIVRNL
jgi:sugar (pentulose or hexulose) kinase